MPEHVDHAVVLFGFAADRFAELVKKSVDKTGAAAFGLVAEQILLRRFACVGKFEKPAGRRLRCRRVPPTGHKMNVHYRQTRHHERTQRADIDGRVDGLENSDDQFFKLDVADDDLCIAGAADHSRVAALERNDLYAFVHFLHVAMSFTVWPVGQAVKPVGQAAMLFGIADVVKAFELRPGLDQRRNSAGQTIAFRIPLSQLGRQHVCQLDLADLGLDLGIGHLGVEIMLKTLFAEQGDEKLLGEVGVGVVLAFFDKKAGLF